VSSSPRHAALPAALVALAVGLVLAAPRADAVAPETVVRESTRAADAAELAAQVRERQHSLATLYRQADARDRALLGRQALLAQYGYHGDPDEVVAVLPLASYSLSAGFGLTGPLWEAEHGGQDFGSYVGDQIVAVAAGVVTEVAYAGPYGLRTIVTLPDGTEVWYCHQTDASVYAGQAVDVADPIGTVGSTGNSTGPHLHLEVRPDGGSPIDPMDWLRAAGLTP
jgi:murein DD-endopeptidase MepM/ murein hydrolase activator NlpD